MKQFTPANGNGRGWRMTSALLAAVATLIGGCDSSVEPPAAKASLPIDQSAIYQTYGVHNSPGISPCAQPDCEYPRQKGEPANPVYPEYWVSDWTMYRVFNNYVGNPPPYPGKPPEALKEGADYQVSYGTTYYDSTWRGAGGEGAMMEHYDKYCLPIFPFANDYTCSFISLGNTAFFVTYDDRPGWMPPVCLFSGFNHPPRRDFIKHLPYVAADSARIGPGGQGYSFWVDHDSGKVMQVGAAPDGTAKNWILFGYGFQKQGNQVLPQSFYFSGVPTPVPNAPIVSQNYTNFRAIKPDSKVTWDQVSKLDPASLPECQLFDPPAQAQYSLKAGKPVPMWGTIGRGRKK